MQARASVPTMRKASSGRRCPAITRRAAVSSGSLRPTRLKGSWTLSAPAQTRAPPLRNAPIAVRPRGVAVGWSRPWRNKLVCGRATTLMPASATSRETASWTSGDWRPSVTQ